MRARLRYWLARAHRALTPKPDQASTVRLLADHLADAQAREAFYRRDYVERCAELIEARQMSGSGPWLSHESRASTDQMGKIRESNPLISQGAFADLELALQNVEWKREVNLSWMEFSRWGIQQIIAIVRLYYIKNPIMRRLIDVCAAYVFARGVEVSSPDDAANEIIHDLFEDNSATLGHSALVGHERSKDTDGNLFFAVFVDRASTGSMKIRVIDATEIQDIVTNPDDTTEPWLYRRDWVERRFENGQTVTQHREAWYPALRYDPDEKPVAINGIPVNWDVPVYHRKCGGIPKWNFGCPRMYPAADWAKEARKYLEACASVHQALSQIAMTLTTKGGQQSLDGAKQQLQTSVGPSAQLWDVNPAAVSGSIFGSGPGTQLAAFSSRAAGGDPEEVRRYLLMCCMVAGVPETFLGDVKTGNLATATSLDRPTETVMLEKQEQWREDLVCLTIYALECSRRAPGGKLREALWDRGINPDHVAIREAARTRMPDGRMVYLSEAARKKRAKQTEIEVKCTFPTIREGDQKDLMEALVSAATLNNRGGQFVGIDEKAFARRAYEIVGIEGGDEIAELQYPEDEYDPDRTQQDVALPIPRAKMAPGGAPQIDPATGEPAPQPTAEALRELSLAAHRAFVQENSHH